jgi:hypothetical protein
VGTRTCNVTEESSTRYPKYSGGGDNQELLGVAIKLLTVATSSGAVRNFLLGELSPPQSVSDAATESCFSCFRKFSRWAHPTPDAATSNKHFLTHTVLVSKFFPQENVF